MISISQRQQQLVEYLRVGFSVAELQELIWRVDPNLSDNFSKTKDRMTLEFVEYCGRHGILPRVWNLVAKERPGLGMTYWDGSLPEPEPEEELSNLAQKPKVTDEATLVLDIKLLLIQAQDKLDILQRLIK